VSVGIKGTVEVRIRVRMRVTQCGEDEGFAIHLCDFVPPTAGFVSTMHACMPWQWSRVYDGCGPECAVVLSHRPVPDSMFNDFPLFVHIYIYGVIYVVPAFLEWWLYNQSRELLAQETKNTLALQKRLAEADRAALARERQAEIDSMTQKQEMERSAFQKSVARMVHDLRTPICAITSGLYALKKLLESSRNSKDGQNHTQQSVMVATVTSLQASNSWCEAFVESGIREMKMLHGGPQAFYKEDQEASVHGMVQDTISLLDAGYQSGDKVEFAFSIATDVPGAVRIDACVQRMLMNLLSNARRHTREGLIRVDVCCEHTQPWLLKFTVTDTGSGVPEEVEAQLFQPFITASDGIGLGIYMVKAQSEALGGSAGYAKNPRQRGAMFFFCIPFVNLDADDNIDPKPDETQLAGNISQITGETMPPSSPRQNIYPPITPPDWRGPGHSPLKGTPSP